MQQRKTKQNDVVYIYIDIDIDIDLHRPQKVYEH